MTDLIQLAENESIAKTGAKPKLPTTIPNLNDSTLDVYRIPLKYLYFNDLNGRIATQINRVIRGIDPHSDETGPEYNDLIAELIKNGNPSKYNQTKKSIKEKGQQVFGYVLKDGRIIDGNRRFTVLRELEKESGEIKFFEAVILPFTYEGSAHKRDIKRLEVSLQLGTEERVDYDPVDLAVDIYKTINEEALMTEKEYAKEASMNISQVQNTVNTVKLMQDFLEFINAPQESYYIIKDVKLYNPLFELSKKLTKKYPQIKGPSYEQTKETAFSILSLFVTTGGDTVREFRDYFQSIMLVGNVNDDFNADIEEVVDELRDSLESAPVNSASDYNKRLNKSVDEIRKIQELLTKTVNKQKRGKNAENLIKDLKDVVSTLEDLNRGNGLTGKLSFDAFSKDQIKELRDISININMLSSDLKEIYEDEL